MLDRVPTSAELAAAPPDIPSITAIALQDYIRLQWVEPTGSTPSANPVGYIVQRSRDNGATWRDITDTVDGLARIQGSVYAWNFNRGVDGYPEATANYGYSPLSGYRFRVKAVNAAGTASLGWTACTVNASQYRSWRPTVPAGGGSRSSMRTAAISWNREANAYGFLRYEIQVRRTSAPPGGDTQWYAPAAGLNAYGTELEYKAGVSGLEFDLTSEEWTQSLPLSGQAAGTPSDTSYEFRVRTVIDVPQAADDMPNGLYASGGKRASAWCTAIAVLAKATSAYDLVSGAVNQAALSTVVATSITTAQSTATAAQTQANTATVLIVEDHLSPELPSATYPANKQVYQTAGAQPNTMWQVSADGASWLSVKVDTSNLSGTVVTNQIATGAVTAEKTKIKRHYII
ncbi:MAG TPA: hypothetical protein DCS09_01210 [Porphyromonadaceae bacterium]|nr:hypothetical protein [Porphyromonadaceae bacterium]